MEHLKKHVAEVSKFITARNVEKASYWTMEAMADCKYHRDATGDVPNDLDDDLDVMIDQIDSEDWDGAESTLKKIVQNLNNS